MDSAVHSKLEEICRDYVKNWGGSGMANIDGIFYQENPEENQEETCKEILNRIKEWRKRKARHRDAIKKKEMKKDEKKKQEFSLLKTRYRLAS